MPLRAAILVLFAVTTIPLLVAIIQINKRSSEAVVRDHAADIVERFRAETMREIVSEFDGYRALIAGAAEIGRQVPDLYTDDRALAYLFSLLRHNATVLNVYVGLQDGSFRQARRIHDADVPVHGAPPPEGAEYAYRLVEPEPGRVTLDRYVFLDADGARLGETAAETGYDPRARPWYGIAVDAGTTTITDPELFWAFGLVGFTVAAPYRSDGALAGVVAVDVTLDRFSDYLAQTPVSPGSLSYVVDGRGLVLAASDGTTRYGSDNDTVSLPHVADAGDRLVAQAYAQRPEADGPQAYEMRHEGRDYLVALAPFDAALGKPWRLLVLTPLDDFTAAFARNANRMLLIGAAAIAIQLALSAVIAGLVASPLRRLARRVARIESLQSAADIPMPRSRVREIDVLSQAVGTLDSAIRAFARFVPVALVRQLIKSDRTLELGGQSRFLTILFCDVEAFSSIAERIAARELLARVSTLFGIVTRGVHDQHGTIDKFVGDGVMAFWGAPVPLDDHAWRACVAALGIQQALERANDDWRRDGAPAMRLRIGIHSDVVLVGNVGSEERMSYTVLGDGVNIASRLEGCNSAYGTGVCISQDTFREAGDRLCARPIDEVLVKGRRTPVTIHELLGAYGAGAALEPDAATQDLARATRAAFDALVAGDRETALAGYRAVLARWPDDPVAAWHAGRLNAADTVPDTDAMPDATEADDASRP